ncbi:hypothetical protein Tco_0532042 [Tanacetum coccineum]
MTARFRHQGDSKQVSVLKGLFKTDFQRKQGDLAAIDTAISDEDQAFLLLTCLPLSYDNLKMTEAKGDGGEGLYVRRRSGQRDMEQRDKELRVTYQCVVVSGLKIMYPVLELKGNAVYGETCKVQVQMMDGSSFVLDNVRYVPKLRRNLISLGTLKKEGFIVKIQSGKIKVIKGSLVVLSGTKRANCVYTLDGQAVTRKTLKGKKQLGEYQIGWKIKTGLQQQNGLVDETNVTLLAKVRCFLIQSGLSKTPIDMLGFFGWLASKRQGMLEPVKVKCIFLNMGFNEMGEYKKTFIGSGVGTGSVQVLQGVEFEVEPQEDHTFEVEPHGNVDHVVGSQEYREDSNEAAFAVAAVKKIYAHKSLNFNNTVACEVISKWKAGLKDDMDARSDVYVLSNGCKKCSDDSDVYYWEYTPDGMVFSCGCKAEIWVTKGLLVKAKGNVLGGKCTWFYNRKLVQTLLEGHSIQSLEGSLSGDCDVEKNGKWSCIYAVGSQEYQMVCTRLDIASADVGMLDKFDRGLQTDVQVFVDFDYAMGRSITSGVYDTYGGCKGGYWAKGTCNRVRIRAIDSSGYCYRCLVKGYPWSEVPA